MCYHKYNMKSQWIEYKDTAVTLRQNGQSLKTIHHNLGIPLSTLSGWLKDIKLSDEQHAKLNQNKTEAWRRAPQKAADWHRTQKALHNLKAKQEAQETLKLLDFNRETLDLALAVLLFGNGSRNENTPISSSNPETLNFILTVLRENYDVNLETLCFDLSMRADQDVGILRTHWSKALTVSPEQFRSVIIDKRTIGKATVEGYMGVCIIRFSSVAIQRKLRYLYTLFCERITDVNLGT
jgi:hypothetical protein